MKAIDIISKGSRIVKGQSCFFIAENNFSYEKLLILKDSLVCYLGTSISVNKVNFEIFHKRNIPEFIAKALPEDGERNYIVEKNSNCNFETEILHSNWHGIWHNNHLDEWPISFSDRLEMILERIKNIPSLEHSGIVYSSLMYSFDTQTNSLDYFINTEPITLVIDGKSVELPSFLEISQLIPGEHCYSINPLNNNFKYFDIYLTGSIFLDTNAVLTGRCAKEFDCEIIGHSKIKKTRISEYFPLHISNKGRIEIDLFDEKSGRTEKYQIRKIN